MFSMVMPEKLASVRRFEKEVERLSGQQTEAMQRARFGGMTLREVKEYGARHRRIIRLLQELAVLNKDADEQQKRKKLPAGSLL